MGENLLLTGSIPAQEAVIGSMLVDDACIPVVLSGMRPEDFSDGTCRATFRAIQRLVLSGAPADPVTILDAMKGGEEYVAWMRRVMEETPTAANVAHYMEISRAGSALCRLRNCADRLLLCGDLEEAKQVVRDMSAALSATSNMPRMTAEDLAKDFLLRMNTDAKPEYLPWGIPTADRTVYAELGDVILLGGYPSAGKTLLSLQMALAQAKRYKVGYYSLETRPEKMADRMFSHLSGVPLDAIKRREFSGSEWSKFAEATAQFVGNCPFDIIRAAGSSVEDISSDAIAKGYQIIYVDYLQLIEVPGVRPGERYAAVTAISRGLKLFAQRHNVAVVALAQLVRPEKEKQKLIPPSMQSFRESGQIEQDADAAFLLWATDPNDNRSSRTLKLGKNKEGKKFSIELSFNGSTQTMVEMEGLDHPYSAAAEYIAAGKAIKARNRAQSSGQIRFSETQSHEDDNPFDREEE